ncbi:MAG: HD domain-containing protein [Omnitrophica WOR_2 bacterium]
MKSEKVYLLNIDKARAWYPATDPVHGFDHVLRVYHLAEKIALAEHADLSIVLAAVLLHDAKDPDEPAGERLNHQHISAAFARKVLIQDGWPEAQIEAVLHCIRAHRFRDDREKPVTLEAKILFDADKLDAIGAIGVARAIGFATLAGQPAYAEPSERFVATGQKEPGEPHSAYHEYIYKLRHLKDRLFTETGRAYAEERHSFQEAYFSRLEAEVRGER